MKFALSIHKRLGAVSLDKTFQKITFVMDIDSLICKDATTVIYFHDPLGICEKPLANQWLIKRAFFKRRDKLVMLT